MKIFVFSQGQKIEQQLSQLKLDNCRFIHVTSEDELFEHEAEKSILIVDIDSVKDYGFILASKIAGRSDKRCLLVGITTMDVDPRDTKFDFFLGSFNEIKNRFKEIVCRYDEME